MIPLAPEPIVRQDGQAKNDCERNASKRFLEALRREHPHVQVIVLEDGLASNGPHLDLLERPELAIPDQCAGARPCGAVPASGGPFGGRVCGPERGGTRRGPPATGGSRCPAQCVPVRPSGDGVAVPGTHPETGPETRTPMDLDHRSAGDPSRGTGDRTDGAQSLEDRKRDLQHAEEPGVRSGTPLRSRSPVPCEYAGDPDAAGVSGGPDPAVVLPALPSRLPSAGRYASLWEKMRGAIWLLILHSWEQLYEALAGAEPDRGSGRPDPGSRPP